MHGKKKPLSSKNKNKKEKKTKFEGSAQSWRRKVISYVDVAHSF